MKTIAARCAAALLSLAAAGAVLSSAPAAFAATAPLPKVSPNSNGLHGQVRPNHVYLGQGAAPETIYLHWTSYGPQAAKATGWVLWPSTRAYPRAVRVDVWRPRHYSGHPGFFFTRMDWTFRSTTGRERTIYFYFGNPYGGTLQVWVQR